MWVAESFSQHLLNISHDGHLLMSSQRILDPLRCGGALSRDSDSFQSLSTSMIRRSRQKNQKLLLCTRSWRWSSLHHLAGIQCDATWGKKRQKKKWIHFLKLFSWHVSRYRNDRFELFILFHVFLPIHGDVEHVSWAHNSLVANDIFEIGKLLMVGVIKINLQ